MRSKQLEHVFLACKSVLSKYVSPIFPSLYNVYVLTFFSFLSGTNVSATADLIPTSHWNMSNEVDKGK